MVVVTDTDLKYKYDTTRHPFSNRYGTIATTISQYKIVTNSIDIDCTPIFHSNVLMKQGTLGYKVHGVDILADKSPRLLYDSNGATTSKTDQAIPTTATGLYVIMWGAGGGGGGGAYQSSTGYDGRGGGGGGSGQCIGFGIKINTLYSSQYTYDCVVGMGGAPGLGGGSDITYSSDTTTGDYGSVGGDTKFIYGSYTYVANGGAGGKRGRVSTYSEGVTTGVNDGAGGTGNTRFITSGDTSGVNINTTDPNAKTNGNPGSSNDINSGGAGGAPVKFVLTAPGFTSYNVTAVAGLGETGTGSDSQNSANFTRPMAADGMSKGGGGAGGNGDISGSGGGFTGVPGSNGHIRIYAYFDNVPTGRYLL
jgi:hypothetical protein